MHVDLYYNKKHCKAFVILGHCKDFNEIMHYVQLFEIHKKIQLPVNDVEFKIIDLYQYKGMVVVAFPLHPTVVFQDSEWIELTKENAHLLKPRIYKSETEIR